MLLKIITIFQDLAFRMQECANKFNENIKFSKIRNILLEVGTNSLIHTFGMQECAENYQKTSNVGEVIVRGGRCCSPTWCCRLFQTSVSPWRLLAKCSCRAMHAKPPKIKALVHSFI